MTKQPELKTIDDGWYETSDLNYNFESIRQAFDNVLFRTAADGESYPENPNFMDVDLDVADANVTNVRRLDVRSIEVANQAFAGFGTQYLWKLGQLSCDSGAMITHDAVGDPVCLPKGTDGEVLKTVNNYPTWVEDIDTDTVGVTVQEDGVTVAENVTTIDFKWTNAVYPTLVTTPAGNQVDIALDDVYTSTISALWEDTRATNDLNIKANGPSGTLWLNSSTLATRVDLVNDVGLAGPITVENSHYVIAEFSNKTTDSSGPPPAVGTWTIAVRFYDSTGTSTPGTGVLIAEPAGEDPDRVGNTDGGNLVTVYCGLPVGTRYVDFYHLDQFLFPLFATGGTVDNRYRAIVTASAKESGFASPNGVVHPGAINPSVTP